MAFWIANADLEVRNRYCIGIKDVAQIKNNVQVLTKHGFSGKCLFCGGGRWSGRA